MPPGQLTPFDKAGLVTAYAEAGYPPAVIAKQLNLPDRTVRAIRDQEGPWKDLQDEPVFAEYRDVAKIQLRAGLLEVARKSVRLAYDKLDDPKLNAYSTIMVGAVSIDKEKQLASEGAVNIAITQTSVDGIDSISVTLSQTLLSNPVSPARTDK
jgi:hypothetical protein